MEEQKVEAGQRWRYSAFSHANDRIFDVECVEGALVYGRMTTGKGEEVVDEYSIPIENLLNAYKLESGEVGERCLEHAVRARLPDGWMVEYQHHDPPGVRVRESTSTVCVALFVKPGASVAAVVDALQSVSGLLHLSKCQHCCRFWPRLDVSPEGVCDACYRARKQETRMLRCAEVTGWIEKALGDDATEVFIQTTPVQEEDVHFILSVCGEVIWQQLVRDNDDRERVIMGVHVAQNWVLLKKCDDRAREELHATNERVLAKSAPVVEVDSRWRNRSICGPNPYIYTVTRLEPIAGVLTYTHEQFAVTFQPALAFPSRDLDPAPARITCFQPVGLKHERGHVDYTDMPGRCADLAARNAEFIAAAKKGWEGITELPEPLPQPAAPRLGQVWRLPLFTDRDRGECDLVGWMPGESRCPDRHIVYELWFLTRDRETLQITTTHDVDPERPREEEEAAFGGHPGLQFVSGSTSAPTPQEALTEVLASARHLRPDGVTRRQWEVVLAGCVEHLHMSGSEIEESVRLASMVRKAAEGVAGYVAGDPSVVFGVDLYLSALRETDR